MYWIERRLLTNDVDNLGIARPSALLKLMHAAADLQMNSEGCSNAAVAEAGCGFILSGLIMRIQTPPREGDVLRVSTWPCESRRYTFVRSYRAERGSQTLAECITRWALVDTATLKLLPVTALDTSRYTLGQALDLGFSGKISFPENLVWEDAGERPVRWSDIDYNAHMNNVVYLDALLDAVPGMEHLCASRIEIRWHAGAPFGETIRMTRAHAEGAWYFKTFCAGESNVEARVVTAAPQV